MPATVMDDLSNAGNGYGRSVDMVSIFGSAQIPIACVVASSGVTAGAAQLQTGVAQTSGNITWTNVGSPTNLVAGNSVKLTSPGAAAAFARIVITTPVSGGVATGVITA